MTTILNIITCLKHIGLIVRHENAIRLISKRSLRSYDAYDEIITLIPDWATEYINNLSTVYYKFIEDSSGCIDQNDLVLPRELSGNGMVYDATEEILNSDPKKVMIRDIYERTKASEAMARTITSLRAHSGIRGVNFDEECEDFKSARGVYLINRAITESIYYLMNKANKNFEIILKNIKSSKKKIEMATLKDTLWKNDAYIDLVSLWGNYIMKVGKKTFFFTTDHLIRLAEYIRALGSISLGILTLDKDCPTKTIIDRLRRLIYKLSTKNPEAVGEWLKAARNLLVCRLDKDKVFGVTMERMMAREYDDIKLAFTEEILDFYNNYFNSDEERLMVSHVYKIIPHPDINLRKSFEKIKGIREPNRINQDSLNLFKGSLRRALYLSMKDQGHDVRAVRNKGDPAIVSMINSTSVDTASLRKTPAIRWQGIVFERVRTIPTMYEVDVPLGDKSSAPSTVFSAETIDELINNSRRSLFDDVKVTTFPKSVNDIQSRLLGNDNLNINYAMQRFRNLIDINKAFESRYPGLNPEDIPTEDLEKFVFEFKEQTYNVATEPKLGEKHKELTRMFYMAEQPLKALTQRVERIGKNISKRQVGVSIVKSYSERRKDLETFCDMMRLPPNGTKPIYISFDMSQFSMKFPMDLLREYGAVLAEITGNKELSRIDLFFRMTKVYHSSRGFFDIFGGIKGGFEGFLNFIWSSIHATVMEIALNNINIEGYLLTYSDDGLLQLLMPEDIDVATIASMIKSIQDTYKEYGLIFHLGKTMVSSMVWEYLGDVCLNGHLIPMWFKELSTFGYFEIDEGFHSISLRKEAIVGQASALAMKGFPAYICEYLALFETAMLIKRTLPKLIDDTVMFMLILPSHAGGLRVPQAMEMAVRSELHSFVETIYDLTVFDNRYEVKVRRLMAYLSDNLSTKDTVVQTIIAGNYFKVDMPDVSGMSILMRLIERIDAKVGTKYQSSTGPFTLAQYRDIANILKNVVNLDPKIINEFMVSTPQWKEFNDLVAIIKSKSALKILGRSVIRRAQAQDTYNVRKAADIITQVITSKDIRLATVPEFVSAIFSKYLKDYDIRPPRPSARYLLQRTYDPHNCDIEVVLNLYDSQNRAPHSIEYVEPTNLPGITKSLLTWSSELTSTRKESYLRKFLNVVAALVVKHGQAYEAFYDICLVLGFQLPNIPKGSMGNIDRLRHYMSGKKDIYLGAPAVFRARSTLRCGRKLLSLYTNPISSDKTTYQEIGRWMGIQEHTNLFRMKGYQGKDIHYYRYNLVEYRDDYFILPNMVYLVENKPQIEVRYEPVKESIALAYRIAIDETIRSASLLASIREPTKKKSTELRKDIEIISEIVSTDMSNIITRLLFSERYAGPSTLAVAPISIGLMQHEIKNGYIKAFISWAFRAYPQSNAIMEWLVMNTEEIRNGIKLLVEEFIKIAKSRLGILPENLYNQNIIQEVFQDIRHFRTMVEREVKTLILKEANPKPIVIFETHSNLAQYSTHNRVRAIKSYLIKLLENIYALGKVYNWDTDKLSSKLTFKAMRISPDWIINMTTLLISIMRPSKHRDISHPYNPTTAIIEMYKFLQCLKEISGRRVRDEADIERKVKLFKLLDEEMYYLREKLKLEEKDVDHLDLLKKEMPKKLAKRAIFLLKDAAKTNAYLTKHLEEVLVIQSTVHAIRNELSSYYSLILSTVVKSLYVYSNITHYALYENLAEETTMKDLYLREIPEDMKLQAKYVQPGSMSDEEARLFATYIQTVLIDEGILKVRLPSIMHSEIASILAINNFKSSSKELEELLTINKPGQEKSFCCIEISRMPKEIFAALAHMTDSRVLMYKKSGKFRLMYYDRGGKIKVGPRLNQTYISVGGTSKTEELLITDITSYTLTLNMIYNLSTSATTPGQTLSRRIVTSIVPTLEDIRYVESEAETIVGNEYLACAILLSKGATSKQTNYAAYLCLMAHLTGANLEDKSIYKLNDRLVSLLLESPLFVRHAINAEIELALTWLATQSVTVRSDHSKLISEILDSISTNPYETIAEPKLLLPGIPISFKDVILMKGTINIDQVNLNSDAWVLADKLFKRTEGIPSLSLTRIKMIMQ